MVRSHVGLWVGLATLAPVPHPAVHIPANSEQRQPLELGSSASGAARLPAVLRARLQTSLNRSAHLGAEVELWPTRNLDGRMDWVVARERTGPAAPWRWVEGETYRWNVAKQRRAIFADVLDLADLYDKPRFGDCVFSPAGAEAEPTLAWPDPADRMRARQERLMQADLSARQKFQVCHALSLPPRLGGRAVEWIAREDHGRWRLVSGPKVEWVDDAAIPPVPATVDGAVTGDWSAPGAFEAFRDAYREDVRIVAGEREALFPVSGRRVTFARKNCALVDHDLEDAADYLAERYAALGISTFRQRFTWRGLPQSNLVAVLPATLPGGSGRPLLLADHYDTAFAEDVYAATGKRVAVPGADDNGSATAALLRAASLLRDVPRREPIWLTHLTGEEYPADDLGARELVSWLKRTHWSVRGFWVMDMIGWRAEGDRLVQISAGDGAEAMAFAAGVRDAFTRVAPGLLPVIRQSNDERAYLYNTDGLVFSEAGWPALLVNEHLNALENLERPDYHHTTDLSGIMDMDFAARVALAVIDAAAAVSR